MVSAQQQELPASSIYQLAGIHDTGCDDRRRSALLQRRYYFTQMRSDCIGRHLTGGEPPRRSEAHHMEHEDRERESRGDNNQRHHRAGVSAERTDAFQYVDDRKNRHADRYRRHREHVAYRLRRALGEISLQLAAGKVVEEPADILVMAGLRRRHDRGSHRIDGHLAALVQLDTFENLAVNRFGDRIPPRNQERERGANSGSKREDRSNREDHARYLIGVGDVAERCEHRDWNRRTGNRDELRQHRPERRVLRLAPLAGVKLVVVDHVGLHRRRQEQARAESDSGIANQQKQPPVVATSQQKHETAAADTDEHVGEVRIELSDPARNPNPERQREKSKTEITKQQDREPGRGIVGTDYVRVEERHHRRRNRAGDAADDVAGEQDCEWPIAQRAPHARHQRVAFARDEIGALLYVQYQQAVEDAEQDAKKDPEPEERPALGHVERLQYAGRRRRDNSAENGERLAPREQRRALVIILRQLGAERVVRQNVDGVKYKVKDEGCAEPHRGAPAGQRRRRIQQAEKCNSAKRCAEQNVRSPPPKPRMRVIGDPAHQRIAQRVERARDRNRHREVPQRYQHSVGIELRHVDEDWDDHAGARETRRAVKQLGLERQWLGRVRGGS